MRGNEYNLYQFNQQIFQSFDYNMLPVNNQLFKEFDLKYMHVKVKFEGINAMTYF
jgi:hypothetical protein